MVAAGTLLFGSCSHVNFSDFRDYFDMPDTFNSWFLVTELHVFMVSNRLMHNQDPDAKIVMQNVQKVLWKDCNQRISNVAAMGGGKKSKMMNKYGQEFLVSTQAMV